MKKIMLILTIIVGTCFLIISPLSAHVIVKPNKVGIGMLQTFDIGVPVEKEVPTIGIRLIIPDNMNDVTPNVKNGWNITVKNDDKDKTKVTEIDWMGGIIPVGQRDDFIFSVQVPSNESIVKWKAYQTYQDGSVVLWDQDPSTIKSGEEGTPYSQTMIINDLTPTSIPTNTISESAPFSKIALMVGIVSSILAIIAILFSLAIFNKTKNNR